MWVRAKSLGFYGHKRRREGAVFQLEAITRMRMQKDKDGKDIGLKEVTIKPEQQFSERWMEKVEGTVPSTEVNPKRKVPGLDKD